MKGIVAEVSGRNAVILLQDGTFKKVRASVDMMPGSEIDMSLPAGNTRIIRFATRAASIAAAAILTIGISYGAYCYTLPYSYVDIDINPSVELTANVFDRIIKVEALNDEAKALLAEHSLKNARLDEGVSQLLNIAVEQGYLNVPEQGGPTVDTSPGAVSTTDSQGENTVLVTVSSENPKKSAELKKKIISKAKVELDRVKVKSDVLAGEASKEQREDAKALGVTPGKLALIEGAMEDQPDLKIEELKRSTVNDLVQKAIDKRNESEATGQNPRAQQGKGADVETKAVYGQTGKNVSGQDQTAFAEHGSAPGTNQGIKKDNTRDKSRGKDQEYKKDTNDNKAAGINGDQAKDKKAAPEGQAGIDTQEAKKDQSKKLRDELLGQKDKYTREKENNHKEDKSDEKGKDNENSKDKSAERGKSNDQGQKKEYPLKQQDGKNGNGGNDSGPAGGKDKGNGNGKGNRH